MSTRKCGSSSRPTGVAVSDLIIGSLIFLIISTACSSPTTTEPTSQATSNRAAESNPSVPSTATTNLQPSTSGPAIASQSAFTVEHIEWVACGAGIECADVAVPVDHSRPTGETLQLAMVRVPSTGPARGSIFVNPGGPGGSGVDYVTGGFRFDDETMASYHLIGFDPRGVGRSSPLRCQVDLTTPRPDLSPDDGDEAATLDAHARSIADACRRLDGDRLAFIGTDSVVADLDLLRQAVGDEKLNYYGLSYGTLIGLRYASRYPDTIGHLALDGIVDPSFGLIDLLGQQAVAFETGFIELDTQCKPEWRCPNGGLVAAYDRLAAQLERDGPIDGVGNAELDLASLFALYDERLHASYVDAINAAESGDFSAIDALHDRFVSGPSYASYVAVFCYDSDTPVGATEWNRFATELAATAPRFGESVANEIRPCAFWPPVSGPPPAPVTDIGDAPILAISTSGDMATPAVNAETIASELDSAALVIAESTTHTAYGTSACVREIVARYFVEDVLPDRTTLC